jgi:hypothetical protein
VIRKLIFFTIVVKLKFALGSEKVACKAVALRQLAFRHMLSPNFHHPANDAEGQTRAAPVGSNEESIRSGPLQSRSPCDAFKLSAHPVMIVIRVPQIQCAFEEIGTQLLSRLHANICCESAN